ncbi:hypothetical protein GCWU000324_01570 [Kingella oralis ATCC 51147]|uniref:Uncharacterized protein n=1 Tax=Kingella oralis ATCC 51147 TaxID=629741 RepID=C4GKR4_9NEIS|nr:hypothetical protein GCWU000324_01570 [Kingella oralis ATCC 51147]
MVCGSLKTSEASFCEAKTAGIRWRLFYLFRVSIAASKGSLKRTKCFSGCLMMRFSTLKRERNNGER